MATENEKCAYIAQVCRVFAECGENAENIARSDEGNSATAAEVIGQTYRDIYSMPVAQLRLALAVLIDCLNEVND